MLAMKILCISDATDTLIYSSIAPDLYRDVDFVISAGDLPLRYYDYIQTMLRKDVYYVYGNHNLEDFARMMKGHGGGAHAFENTGGYHSMPAFGGFFLDGKAAALIGTHTKVITADEMVTDQGLAYITDNGRVGSALSVGGFLPETEIQKIRSQIPVRSQECWDDGIIEGVIVDIDETTGKSTAIQRVMEHLEIEPPEKSNEADSDNSGN